MCGLVGFLLLNHQGMAGSAKEVLKNMGARIEARGPDDQQVYLDNTAAFLFQRLSIVDIQDGGQPFISEDGQIVLMINGEIYNHLDLRRLLKNDHRFRSRSDCEVILHLYEEQGMRFLGEVNGMFAISQSCSVG